MRKVVGKLVSRVWGTEVAVRRAEMLSPRVKRIVFAGEALHSLKWTPGDKVKLACSAELAVALPAGPLAAE